MAQCRGTTKKGDRCRRDAREGSPFCAIHTDEDAGGRDGNGGGEDWDMDAILKTAIGFGLICAILLFRFRR